MLRRKPTRIDLSQADIDELDVVRRERAADTKAPERLDGIDLTRREQAVAGKSDRARLGLPDNKNSSAGIERSDIQL